MGFLEEPAVSVRRRMQLRLGTGRWWEVVEEIFVKDISIILLE